MEGMGVERFGEKIDARSMEGKRKRGRLTLRWEDCA